MPYLNPTNLLEELQSKKHTRLDLGSFSTAWTKSKASHRNCGFETFEDFLKAICHHKDVLGGVLEIDLCNNGLNKLPEFVWHTPNLRKLNLSRNRFEKLPENIMGLSKLEVLNLKENSLQEVPEGIEGLNALVELDLSVNPQLKVLPLFLARLPGLKRLKISRTKIKEISEHLLWSASLEEISWTWKSLEVIGGHQVNDIPKQSLNDLGALREYLRNLNLGVSHEVKLILLGDSKAGKTTVLKNLKEKSLGMGNERERTPGLKVNFEEPIEGLSKVAGFPLRINAWDFGGQDEYRVVQQLFCSPGAVYVLALSPLGMEQEEDRLRGVWWLQMLSAFRPAPSGKSKLEPLIQVTTRVTEPKDGAPVLSQEILAALPPDTLLHEVDFCGCIGDIKLRKSIMKVLAESRVAGQKIKPKWGAVRLELRHLSQRHKPTISLNEAEFDKICAKHGIEDEGEIHELLSYLNESGAVLFYQEHYSQTIFLDPDWIRKAAFIVLALRPTKEATGWMDEGMLSRIWPHPEFKKWERNALIQTMEDLGLCYPAEREGKKFYVFPSLFPSISEQKKTRVDKRKTLAIRFDFSPLLPVGLISRLLVRIQSHSFEIGSEWRDAVTLIMDNCQIDVRERWNGLDIELRGHDAPVQYNVIRDLLLKLVSEYRASGMHLPEVQDEVLCPCIECGHLPEESVFRYSWDQLNESLPGEQLQCRSGEIVPRAKILNEFALPGTRSSQPTPQYFLSYCGSDLDLATEIEKAISPDGKILNYRRLRVGAVIKQYMKQIKEADAVVFLLSKDSLNSRFVQYELGLALRFKCPIMVFVRKEKDIGDQMEQSVGKNVLKRILELKQKIKIQKKQGLATDSLAWDLQLWEQAQSGLGKVFLKLGQNTRSQDFQLPQGKRLESFKNSLLALREEIRFNG